jgi:spore germination protein YaaH
MARARTLVLIAATAAAGVATAGCGSIPVIGRRAPEFWAFAAPGDPAGAASAARNRGRLDALVSGWMYLDSATGAPTEAFPDTVGRPLRGDDRRLLLVTSWHGNRFHQTPIRGLAAEPARLGAAARIIATAAAAGSYDGLVLDFESLEPGDAGALLTVVRALRDSARRRGVEGVTLAVPVGDTAAYPGRALVGVADRLLVMLYDQHPAGGPPGPISDPEWVRRSLAVRIAEVGPSRLVAGLPAYGYQWPLDRGPAVSISYDDARRLATEAGTTLARDPASYTLTARRTGPPGDAWELWVTDAELLRVLVDEISRAGVRTFALWRLGQEDESVWTRVVR